MKPNLTAAVRGFRAASVALALGALAATGVGHLAGCSRKDATEAPATNGGANAAKPSRTTETPKPARDAKSAEGAARTARARKPSAGADSLYVGELTPEASLDLMTTVGGRLVAVHKKLGDPVEKGEVVAVMDDEEIRKQIHEGEVAIEAARAQVARAQQELARVRTEGVRAAAEVRRLEVELGRARREHDRNQPLYERGVINASAWDAVKTALDSGRAGLESASAAVASAKAGESAAASAVALAEVQVRQAAARVETGRVQLRNTRIRAPFAGTINQRYLDPGAFLVSMNPRPIVQIVATAEVNVRFKVPERDLRQLALGKDVRVRVEAYPGEVFEAKVTRLSAALEAATRAAVVEAALPNKEGRLRPGMFARVGLAWTSEAANVLVPQRAVVRDEAKPGQASVWLVEAGKVTRKPIEAVRDTGAETEVRGLTEGAEVVVEGLERLKAGEPLTPPPAAAAAP